MTSILCNTPCIQKVSSPLILLPLPPLSLCRVFPPPYSLSPPSVTLVWTTRVCLGAPSLPTPPLPAASPSWLGLLGASQQRLGRKWSQEMVPLKLKAMLEPPRVGLCTIHLIQMVCLLICQALIHLILVLPYRSSYCRQCQRWELRTA